MASEPTIIKRRECAEHGPVHEDNLVPINGAPSCCPICLEVAPKRTYVAVDALLSDEAVNALATALPPWTPNAMIRGAIEALIEAVSSDA